MQSMKARVRSSQGSQRTGREAGAIDVVSGSTALDEHRGKSVMCEVLQLLQSELHYLQFPAHIRLVAAASRSAAQAL